MQSFEVEILFSFFLPSLHFTLQIICTFTVLYMLLSISDENQQVFLLGCVEFAGREIIYEKYTA